MRLHYVKFKERKRSQMSDYIDDFSEDEEERKPDSKGYRIVKRGFKILLFGASALVWALIIAVIISTREAKLFSQMHFGDRTRALAEETENAGEEFRVHELHTNVFMNIDGSISVGNVWYCAETGELELGIRINRKLLKYTSDGAEKTGTPAVALTDENGNVFRIVRTDEDTIGRYSYLRVCFEGIELTLGESSYAAAKAAEGNADGTPVPVLSLSLTLSETGSALASHYDKEKETMVDDAVFVIFDHETPYKTVEYDG